MSNLIFFGAGASAPFGIPTMREMVEKFESYLSKENINGRNLYSNIKKALERGYKPPQIDIESIFSVIVGIAEQITPQELSHFAFYCNNRFGREVKFTDTEIKEAINLHKELEKFIQRECEANESVDDIELVYHQSYKVFFDNQWGITYQHNEKNIKYPWGFNAFTTNYDTIFENYWMELKPLIDHFNRNETQVPYFDPNKEVTHHDNTITKLHGSINWTILEDGDILEAKPSIYTHTRKKGRAMLYPIQQKDLYLHPWSTLFQSLRLGLKRCNLWYVVGYAFNDEYVLNAFNEAFSDNKRMVIINPHAIKLKEKFKEKDLNKITALPIKFGGKFFTNDFEDFSKSERRIEVELSGESKTIGIDFPKDTKFIETVKNENCSSTPSITNHDNRTSFEFYSQNSQNKRVIFDVTMRGHDFKSEEYEFLTLSSGETTVHVALRNQGRLIDSFTTSKPMYDSIFNTYIQSFKIRAEKFFPH